MILAVILKLYPAFNKFMIRFVFTYTWYQAIRGRLCCIKPQKQSSLYYSIARVNYYDNNTLNNWYITCLRRFFLKQKQ